MLWDDGPLNPPPVRDDQRQDPAIRVVTCELRFAVSEPAQLVLQIAAATTAGQVLDERFDIDSGDPMAPVPRESMRVGAHQSRMDVLTVERGLVDISYRSVIRVTDYPVEVGPGSSFDQQIYLRPSRYCPSDHLVGFAVAEFGVGDAVGDRVRAIADWIGSRVGYVPGSSTVHDSAEDTLLTGTGTCRDFAHLGVALCRATGIPARFSAVYAPGLNPMDFHAVFEAYEDGAWWAYDATGLAPRSTMVRIATGRDAADTAFAGVTRGIATLEQVQVSATAGGELPADDHSQRIHLL